MKVLQRIKLKNFKRFGSFDANLDRSLNLLVGDNESGKSTILLALDLVLSGSRGKVEAIGLESLFNTEAVSVFDLVEPFDRIKTALATLHEQGVLSE